MITTEYFAKGTIPKEPCVHHAAVRVCATSGMLAGPYCPGRSYASSVRIIGGSPDSADGPYLYTGNLRKCTVHTSAPPVVPEPPVTQEPDTPSENPDAGTNANPGEGTNTDPPQAPDAGADAEPDAGTGTNPPQAPDAGTDTNPDEGAGTSPPDTGGDEPQPNEVVQDF